MRKRRDAIVELGIESSQVNHLVATTVVRIRDRQPGIQSLIVTGNSDRVRDLSNALRIALRQIDSAAQVLEIGGVDSARQEAVEISREPDIVVATNDRVIDHLRRGQLDLSNIALWIVDEPDVEASTGFNVDVEFIWSKIPSRPQIVVFCPTMHGGLETLQSLLHRPMLLPFSTWHERGKSPVVSSERQRNHNMAPGSEEERVNGQQSGKEVLNEEAVREHVEEIIRRIHEDENPEELNAYRKLVRKHVPFFTRGYFAAWLLKYGVSGGTIPKGGRGDRSRNGFTSLFVGIGKNRRVFPRDLIQLFSGIDGVSSDDIGEIKILDNYSFVEINPSKANGIIDELNGKDFRGRRLNVNFARKKD